MADELAQDPVEDAPEADGVAKVPAPETDESEASAPEADEADEADGATRVPAPRRRRAGRRILAALAIVGCLGLLAFADWRMRVHEMDVLVGQAESVDRDLGTSVGRITTDLDSMIDKGAGSPEWRTAEADAQAAAGQGAQELTRRSSAMDDAVVLPWHRGVVHARSRYLDHVTAWQTVLGSMRKDVSEMGDLNSVVRTLTQAKQAMHDAVPPRSKSLHARIDALAS